MLSHLYIKLNGIKRARAHATPKRECDCNFSLLIPLLDTATNDNDLGKTINKQNEEKHELFAWKTTLSFSCFMPKHHTIPVFLTRYFFLLRIFSPILHATDAVAIVDATNTHIHSHASDDTATVSQVPFAFTENVNFSKCVTSIYFVCLRSLPTLNLGSVQMASIPCSQSLGNWWFWHRISSACLYSSSVSCVYPCVPCRCFLVVVEFPGVCLPGGLDVYEKSHKSNGPALFEQGKHSERNRQQQQTNKSSAITFFWSRTPNCFASDEA